MKKDKFDDFVNDLLDAVDDVINHVSSFECDKCEISTMIINAEYIDKLISVYSRLGS